LSISNKGACSLVVVTLLKVACNGWANPPILNLPKVAISLKIKYNKCTMKIQNHHDKLFKELFSQEKNAKDLIENFLSKDLVSELDLNTLQLTNNSYTDKKLKVYYSDLVYLVEMKDKSKAMVSLLFEHKSKVQEYPHFQLIQYMLQIWTTQQKQKEELTLVIPIIFYHGKEKWKFRNLREYFGATNKVIEKYIPNFDYNLIDLSSYNNKEIKEKITENFILTNSILLMKNIFLGKEEIMSIIENIFTVIEIEKAEEKVIGFLESLFMYIYSTTRLDPKEFETRIKKISEKGAKTMITTATKLRKEGRQLGRQEGMQEGESIGLRKAYERMVKTGISSKEAKKILGMD
jgi:predicted transposase/invertase (TIGR01784 family)